MDVVGTGAAVSVVVVGDVGFGREGGLSELGLLGIASRSRRRFLGEWL